MSVEISVTGQWQLQSLVAPTVSRDLSCAKYRSRHMLEDTGLVAYSLRVSVLMGVHR